MLKSNAALATKIELKDDETIIENDETKIVTKALDDLKDTVDQKLSDFESKALSDVSVRIDGLEKKLNRPALNIKAGNDDENVERKAFANAMRYSPERLNELDRKALTVADDSQAGYLAPINFASELIKLLKEFSPIRQYAKVVSIGAKEVKYPRRTGSPAANWVNEGAARTSSEPAYEQIGIEPHELGTYVDVSNALLEDSAFDIESELRSEFAEAFGTAEGAAFVSGDGTGKPTGLLSNTDISIIKTGTASAFPATSPADVLIGAYHALPTAFAQRGVWMMNRNTLATIRKWKDSDGRYLVVDPITENMGATLLGRPIVEALDMPDIAANATPVVFGDLSGYRIVDRIQLSVLRDPYSRATNSETRFHARKRVGADVTHPDRFLKIKCAA